jgi:hypothetical protein
MKKLNSLTLIISLFTFFALSAEAKDCTDQYGDDLSWSVGHNACRGTSVKSTRLQMTDGHEVGNEMTLIMSYDFPNKVRADRETISAALSAIENFSGTLAVTEFSWICGDGSTGKAAVWVDKKCNSVGPMFQYNSSMLPPRTNGGTLQNMWY